ncbi:hypothetical protein NM688_g6598 [Phlebia brevispora]|uniref:Uncharacterized protein n=1 Tax=Phlebia brevispora TaxID=194682 RepID=A0ACC1SEF4_9APHY|nr:hypothetical protein NM688_g6598 [Phlebia brevispora]
MHVPLLFFSAFLPGSLAFPHFPGVGSAGLLKRNGSDCDTGGPASFQNTTAQPDLCCFEYPGGLLLQTQFWDTNPPTGPSNGWTIHGLWPDNCDGTFEQNCDPSRDYHDISGLLTSQGAASTLKFMQTFWVDINGKNEQFWEHEWSTHGTCYSTLEPSCLPPGSPVGAEAVAFFVIVVNLFQTLPTYDWLAAAGISPDDSQTYSLADITSALQKASGVIPALDCRGSTISQISWYFNIKGSVIDGEFLRIDAPFQGSCASNGLLYPVKGFSNSTNTTASPSAASSAAVTFTPTTIPLPSSSASTTIPITITSVHSSPASVTASATPPAVSTSFKTSITVL